MRANPFYNCILIFFLCHASGCEPEAFTPVVPNVASGTAVSVSSVSFEARWHPFPQADYYLLEVATDPAFKNLVNETYPLSVKDTSQLVNKLNPETRYYFRVAAYTTSGTFINYAEPTPVETLKLGKPLVHGPVPTEQDISQVHTVWSPVNEAEGYELQLAGDINFDRIIQTYDKTSQQDTVQLIDSLQSNRTYFYRVRSVRDGFTSDFSNIMAASTAELAQPQMHAPDRIDYTSVTLTWQTEDQVNSYRLEVGTDPLFQEVMTITYDLELTDNSLTLPDLTPNTGYYARVRSRQDTLFSIYSEILGFKTLALEAPPNLSLSAADQGSLTLSWEEITDAESYEADIAEDSLFRTILPAYNAYAINAEHITFSDLSPGKTYFVRVRSYGFSSYSEYSTLEVSTTGLAAPTNISVQDRMLKQFTLGWDEMKGAESYLLDVATDADFTDLVTGYVQKEVFSGSIAVTGLSAESVYYIRLSSKHKDMLSNPSEPVEVPAALPQACTITERSWDDGWTERYQYNNGLLVQIEGDSAGMSTSRYRWDIQWNTNGAPDLVERYIADAGGTMLLSETWEYAYTAGKWSSLHRKDAASTTLELIQLGYNTSEQLTTVNSFADAAATVPNYQENYAYQGGMITEAYKETSELVRTWKYSNYYYPENLFTKELHVLLRNPATNGVWGYIPAEAVSVYELFTNAGVQRQAYVYETNAQGMPVKVYTGEIQTTTTYRYQSCGF